MSYTTSITCDCGCEATVQVPSPGQLPVGWIVMSWPMRTVLSVASPNVPMRPQSPQQQPGIEQHTMMFARWSCVNKQVKIMLRGEEPVAE